MQKISPNSKVLRQTTICMAAAAVVATAALPMNVMASAVPQPTAQWENDRNSRIAEIKNEIKAIAPNLEKLVATRQFAETVDEHKASILAAISNQANLEKDDSDALLLLLNATFGEILNIDDQKLSSAGVAKKKSLEGLKKKLDAAAAATSKDDKALTKALGDLGKEVGNHASFVGESQAALAPVQRQADRLAMKEARVTGAKSKSALAALKATRQLDATTPNATKHDGALTWSDKHLTNFMGAEAVSDTHAVITKDTTLELTSASGDRSDALAGATGKKREIGTLRALDDAAHLVTVTDGTLNVHQGIEGQGELTIAVSTDGQLNFKGGAGIAHDMETVSLSAGRGVGNTGKGGEIVFGEGTNAGHAVIDVFDHGKLTFAKGANAGRSDIGVRDGGEVRFDEADAAVSNVSNQGGTVEFKNSKLAQAEIANDRTSLVGFVDSALDTSEVVNLGTAVINGSRGGEAHIINGAGGKLYIKDSELEALSLVNVGTAEMSGNTTAHSAKIDMFGGTLDISKVTAAAPGRKAEKTLSIGALSGVGDVVTGDTKLVLGERNEDDRFEGSIKRDAVASNTASKASGILRANPTAPQVGAKPAGSEVVKVGVGNLTLAGDQRGITSLRVEGGTVSAAHVNALGTGTVTVAEKGAVSLLSGVAGVGHFDNAGKVDLGTHKLAVEKYTSKPGAKIQSRVEKVGGQVTGGAIQVSQDSDFTQTEIKVSVADDIALADVQDKLGVVSVAEGKTATLGKVTVGSITGGKTTKPTDPDGPDTNNPDDPNNPDTTKPVDPNNPTGLITSENVVRYLAADAGYRANEKAVLASVDGVTVGELTSGKIGGKVLSEMALQTAGSAEQRRSASLLSGESLLNNATAAQGATTAFQRGMQSRMVAGGAMLDDKTANGVRTDDSGIAGWASFAGGNATQRGDALSFDVRGIDGAIGVDKRVGRGTVVGASIGMGNQNVKADGMPGESKINSVSVGLYGSHLNDANLFVNGGVSYTNHSVTTDRTVAARNASARLSGKTGGNTFGAFGEIGKRFDVAGFRVDPSVGMRIASTKLNAFDETNRDGTAGNDGLKVGAQSQTSARSVLGVRFSRDVFNFDGGKLTPSLRLAYEHEFGNTQSSLTNTIYGAPRAFNVKGPKLGREVFTADFGVDLQLKKRLDVHLGGNVSVRKGESALAGGISAKYRF
ncbi:hypothetical protein A9762_07790 [Pandoraea sp. ISTKB]|nr:hypothetical protein A9762_07790 [Pandoraea sp. ISTKB]